MPTTPWGDPDTGSFRNRNIREARVDGSVALVNAKLVAAVSRLLEGIVTSGASLPKKITSYDPAGTEYQRLGLSLRIDIPYDEELGALLERWGFEGVQLANEPVPEFRFVGSPSDADDVNDRALASHLDALESVEVSGPTPHKWPGHRTVVIGDIGQDVRFLQLLLGAQSSEGIADEELLTLAEQFQRRRGAPERELRVLDAAFWRRIIPRRLPTVYSGETGFNVKLVQAALAAQGFASTKVTGIYGVLTAKDVRNLQKEFHLRIGNYVRAPEWALLLGPNPWSSIAADDTENGSNAPDRSGLDEGQTPV